MITAWLNHIDFAYGWVLSLLIAVPILIIEYLRKHRKQNASMMVTTTHFLDENTSFENLLYHLPFVLRIATIICFIVALARPQLKNVQQQTEGEGIDLVLCFDISGSMTAKDFPPTRLEAAKEVAKNFVEGRPGDRIGIVIFSNQSFTLCPITTDHQTVLNQINNIQSGYLLDDGTAIGSGLATSVDRLRSSSAKTKVVILLTDGVDFGGIVPPDIAKDIAKLYNIKVYAIGIGSEKEVDELVNTPYGAVNQKKKLEFNEQLLKTIASETKGRYFHAADKEALSEIYKSINQLEKSTIKATTYNRYTDVFYPWLIAGLILLFAELMLRYTLLKKFP